MKVQHRRLHVHISKPSTCRSPHNNQYNCLEAAAAAAAIVFVFPAVFLRLDLAAGTILPPRYCTCIYTAHNLTTFCGCTLSFHFNSFFFFFFSKYTFSPSTPRDAVVAFQYIFDRRNVTTTKELSATQHGVYRSGNRYHKS